MEESDIYLHGGIKRHLNGDTEKSHENPNFGVLSTEFRTIFL
jgi:hypothetical protein